MTFKGFIRNRQETIGILGLLLIVLSLTGLLGCPSPTPPAESATPMTGTFTYEDLTTAVGNQKEGSPEWSGNADKQLDSGNIGYTITPPSGKAGTGVTINPDDGKITVGTTATVEASSGTYTVKASGSGAFTGEIKATVKVTINATATPMEGELTYDDLTVAVGSSKEISPSWSGNVDKQLDSGNIEYTITPPSGKAGTGVTINTDNGKITVGTTATAEASSGEYTVTATGKGAFQGTKTAKIQITITITAAKDIGGSFSYTGTGLTAVVGNIQISPKPAWIDEEPGQTVEYSITNPPNSANTDHVTIHTATGAITITNQALVASSGKYTVTATGTGDWQGTKTAEIEITIKEAPKIIGESFSYIGLSTLKGTPKTSLAPTWTGAKEGQTVVYSITNRPNSANTDHVTIHTATGAVTITDQALAASTGTYTVTAKGTGDWQGTKTAEIEITIKEVAEDIEGSFSYTGLSAFEGTAKTSLVPIWTVAGQTVEYSITDATGAKPTHVTVNTVTGAVTITTDALVASSGRYTVTATGTGAFQGTKTAEIEITITAAKGIEGKFYYYEFTIAAGNTGSKSPIWSGQYNPDQLSSSNIEYTITPPVGNAGTGVGLEDHQGGRITIDSSATPASSGTYTVTAKGIGAFKGTITSEIKITINAEAIPIAGELSYDDGITAAVGNTGSKGPIWRGQHNPDQRVNGNIKFTITPPGAGVTIDNWSGVVLVSSSATVASSGTYTVTAKGLGLFGGTITGTIKITINAEAIPIIGKFSYEDLRTAVGNATSSLYPQWSGHDDNPDQLTGGNIEYSIASPNGNAGTGVTIHKFNGLVSISSSAPLASSGTYTVTAKGAQAFEGTITTTIKITINAEPIPIAGKLSYDDLTTAVGTPWSVNPQWSGHDDNPDQISPLNIKYSITPPDGNDGTGVTIPDMFSGRVLTSASAPAASSGTYTITAEGMRAFGGTITGTIKITITE